MEKNLYFRTTVRRKNLFADFFQNFFMFLSSWPKLALEVFVRKNFGQRYCTLSSVLTVAALLFLYPIVSDKLPPLFSGGYGYGHHGSFFSRYASWYLFLIAFLAVSAVRLWEIKSNPSVYDLGRCSTYAGDINTAFFNIRPFGKNLSYKTIETFMEPVAFFLIGYVLKAFGQNVGMLLMVCSVFYSLGYRVAYKKSDDFIMDQLDEMMYGEEMEDAFVDDNYNNAKGVRFYGTKPSDKELRRKLSERFVDQDSNVSYAI
jgi:hypothetical protein